MDLRNVKLVNREKLKQFKELQLRVIYLEICNQLDLYYSPETVRTKHEEIFSNQIKKYTKLKFFKSVWIGRRCVDIFIPSLAGSGTSKNKMKGLVVELNGSIHDEYEKMNRDENLGNYLQSIGIGLASIDNYDLRHSNVISFFEQLPNIERIDFRARQRLWRTIYIETIRKNEDLIRNLGNLSASRALEILRRVQ